MFKSHIIANIFFYIEHSDRFDDVFSDEIVPKNTDDLIPSEFRTQESDEYVWIAEYYMDVVKKGNREILREYRPAAIKKYGEPGEDYYDWYTYILSHNMISNCVIELDLSQFFIENINIIESEFKIETDKYKLDEDMLSKSNINMAEPHALYFIYDGDTANVFVDDLNTKLYSMVKIKKTDYEKLENFIQRKTNLIQDFTFPRHADGTCDYDEITTATSNISNIDEPATESAPAMEHAKSAEEALFPEIAESDSPNKDDVGAKKSSALPIVPIAAGGAAFAVLLAVILFAVKKRKFCKE